MINQPLRNDFEQTLDHTLLEFFSLAPFTSVNVQFKTPQNNNEISRIAVSQLAAGESKDKIDQVVDLMLADGTFYVIG